MGAVEGCGEVVVRGVVGRDIVEEVGRWRFFKKRSLRGKCAAASII